MTSPNTTRKHIKKRKCSCDKCSKITNPFVEVEDYDTLPPDVEPYEYDYE